MKAKAIQVVSNVGVHIVVYEQRMPHGRRNPVTREQEFVPNVRKVADGFVPAGQSAIQVAREVTGIAHPIVECKEYQRLAEKILNKPANLSKGGN